jgi:hypothetical protein
MVENASISGAVLSARDRKKSSEAAIVQGESRVQARVRWLAAIDQQVGVSGACPSRSRDRGVADLGRLNRAVLDNSLGKTRLHVKHAQRTPVHSSGAIKVQVERH